MQRLLIGLLGCVVVACGCSGGTMTSYRLGQDAGSLASLSADGELLATLAAEGDAPSSYVATHASELGADCGDLASVLRGARPRPGTAGDFARLVRMSELATDLLEQLEQHPGERETAASLARRLGAVADHAAQIEESA